MEKHRQDTGKTEEITALLKRIANGNLGARAELMRVVEAELRRIASRHMRKERRDHTLQATALVNETYIRLFHQGSDWRDRDHFFVAASHVMRQVLIDYARARKAQRRGGQKNELNTSDVAFSPIQPDILDIDIALKELAEIAPRQAQLVELRFFGGLSSEQAARVLEVAARTADKDWAMARSWLRRRLTK